MYYDTIHLYPTIQNCGYFPLLMRKSPIQGGFSWGGKMVWNDGSAGNMSLTYDVDGKKAAYDRMQAWLAQLRMPVYPQVVQIMPKERKGISGDASGVLEITETLLKTGLAKTPDFSAAVIANAEFIYTKVKGVTLCVKPADCPSVIVYAKNKKGQDIIGVGHWGRSGVNVMNPYLALLHLREQEGCDPENIYIGIAPGLGAAHHTLRDDDIIPTNGAASKLDHWLEWAKRKTITQDKKDMHVWHINLLKEIIWQLRLNKISEEHIEAYRIDTYTAAERGETFSHRYSLVKEITEGRMVVAASLKEE